MHTPHDTRPNESLKLRINPRYIYVEDYRTMTPTTTKFLLTASIETSRDVESNKKYHTHHSRFAIRRRKERW